MVSTKKTRSRLFKILQKKRHKQRRAEQDAKMEMYRVYESDTVVEFTDIDQQEPDTFFSKGIEFGVFGR